MWVIAIARAECARTGLRNSFWPGTARTCPIDSVKRPGHHHQLIRSLFFLSSNRSKYESRVRCQQRLRNEPHHADDYGRVIWMELMCIKRRHENGCVWPSEGCSPAVVVAKLHKRWVTRISLPVSFPLPTDCSFICKLNGFVRRHNIAGLARPNFRSWTSVQNRIFQQYRRTHSLFGPRKSISWGNSRFSFS